MLWNLQTWTWLSFYTSLLPASLRGRSPIPLTWGKQTAFSFNLQWRKPTRFLRLQLMLQYILHQLFTQLFILGDVGGWYPVSFCLCVYFSCTFNIFKGYIVFMVHWGKKGLVQVLMRGPWLPVLRWEWYSRWDICLSFLQWQEAVFCCFFEIALLPNDF